MKSPSIKGPWKFTGMSRSGSYFKVRGTVCGSKFEIANVPFISEGGKFYGVEEAEIIAQFIASAPAVYNALENLVAFNKSASIPTSEAQIALITAAEKALELPSKTIN